MTADPADSVTAVLDRAFDAMREAATANIDQPFRLTVMAAVLIATEPRIVLEELLIVDPGTREPLDRLVPGALATLTATIDAVPVSREVELLPR